MDKETSRGPWKRESARLQDTGIGALRWVLGVVVFLQSAHFALSSTASHSLGEAHFPLWFPWALGGSEALAALLILVPATALLGGYALLFIFAIAIAVHLLHGQYDVGGLLVYGMAAFVCIARQKNSRTERAEG